MKVNMEPSILIANSIKISDEHGIKVILCDDVKQKLIEIASKNQVLLVSDENLFKRFKSILGLVPKLILPQNVKPEIKYAQRIARYRVDLYIAFGSGTINDLCKYASFLNKTKYILFPTATSMNGYSSPSASIQQNNIRRSIVANTPSYIYYNLEILCGSPQRLKSSGLGDLLARKTSQSDLILSNIAFNIRYNPAIFKMLAPYEEYLIENHSDIFVSAIKHKQYMNVLISALIVSGIGMKIAGDSSPASQGEHSIAHAMNQLAKENDFYFHGEQISVTSIIMDKIQCEIIDNIELPNPIKYKIPFPQKQELMKIYKAKILKYKNTNITYQEWKSIKKKINSISIKHYTLEKILKNIKLPTTPQEIGWNSNEIAQAIKNAPFIRERYGFLDLIHELDSTFIKKISRNNE